LLLLNFSPFRVDGRPGHLKKDGCRRSNNSDRQCRNQYNARALVDGTSAGHGVPDHG
jgi:hypothetical protein